MNSVKTKIIALVLCGIILSSAAVGSAGIINSRRVVANDSAKIMNLMCDQRAEEINSLFSRIRQSVDSLTVYATHQLDDVEAFKQDSQYVKNYSDSLLDVAINAGLNTEGALTVYIRYNPDFTEPDSGFFYGKNTANGLFSELPPTNLTTYNTTDREHVGWFYEPAIEKKAIWMEPYYNENIKTRIISYVVPYYVNNEFIGVVGMDIDFSLLERIVASTTVYQTGYAFLTDAQTKIIYHKDLPSGTDLIQFNQGEFHEMAEMLRSETDSGSKLITYSYEGDLKEAAFQSMENNMRLAITAPKSEIDAEANKLLFQILGAVLVFVLVAFTLTVIFTKRWVRPLLELTDAAKKIAGGDLSVSITHQSNDEIGALAESFRQTVAHLHKYISYINELAYRDSLTGMKNKTAYLEVVSRMDELTRLKRPQYAVVVFDINGLKTVNDTLGHDFGDMLIINACKLISQVFRRSPIYRIGGDEFVLLLEDQDYDQYTDLLIQLQIEIDSYNKNPQNELKISIARGIAVFSEETDLTYNDVFKRADNAMYRNKTEMKNKENN